MPPGPRASARAEPVGQPGPTDPRRQGAAGGGRRRGWTGEPCPRDPTRSIGRAALPAALRFLMAVPVGAEPREGRPFHWTGVLKPGQKLTIHGVNGGIHAEPSTGTEVVLDAEKHGRHGDPDRVEIQVERENAGGTILSRKPRWWGRGRQDRNGV